MLLEWCTIHFSHRHGRPSPQERAIATLRYGWMLLESFSSLLNFIHTDITSTGCPQEIYGGHCNATRRLQCCIFFLVRFAFRRQHFKAYHMSVNLSSYWSVLDWMDRQVHFAGLLWVFLLLSWRTQTLWM